LEVDDVVIPIPDAAPAWAHDRDRGARKAGEDFSWNRRPDMKFGRGRKAGDRPDPGTGRRWRAALMTGALLATFCLGWIGGSASHRLATPQAASSPLKQRLNASARITAGRDAPVAAPGVRKPSAAPAGRPEPAPVALDSGMRSLPRLVPVPETRPTTIAGWTVRDVSGGVAALEGPNGIWRAARGDLVPGVGRVDSIVRWGNYWLVSTSRGLIASE
jgi:hypothetical protein